MASNIIGYETEYISEYEKAALEEYGLTKESFKCKSMPELRAKGSFRAAFAPYNGLGYKVDGEFVRLAFSLPAGSYATVLLSELIQQE